MDMSLYDFSLPESLIAQQPAQPRDHARLLVYKLDTGDIIDSVFHELDSFLYPDTTLVVNNSKVEHCRWLFENGRTELFLLEKLDTHTVRALVRPGRKFKPGNSVQLSDFLQAKVIAQDDEGIRTLKLSVSHDDRRLQAYEHVPLPPYIEQNDALADEYQTVYARPTGSLAAPTAGLHFTDELLKSLREYHTISELTLHVGLGTFAKLTEEHIRTKKLHEELYELSEKAATQLTKASHITAVGTTSVRTLESVMQKFGHFEAATGGTEIFIQPGYTFRAVNSIVTNFHLPQTSLLMLIAAFIADKKQLSETEAAAELQRIYKHAVAEKYRFYSFGDAMLLV